MFTKHETHKTKHPPNYRRTMSKKKKSAQPAPGRTQATAVIPMISEKTGLLLCLLLTFLVFANTFGAGFVNWDDHGYLWLNPLVQPLSGKAISDMFSSHTCGNYSPLVVLTYCIEHGFDPVVQPGMQVADNFRPFLYHFNNVVLHVATTAMAFFLLRALGLRSWGLLLATALFGIHPMRVESVAWVTERKDVLYGVFYLAALFTYWKYLQQPEQKTKWYLITLLLGLLALFSKIQAVSLPLSMLTLDYLAKRDLKKTPVWLEKAPFFALSLVFGLVGLHFLDVAEGLKDTGYPPVERFFFASWSLFIYLVKFVAPTGLSAYYPYPETGKIPVLYYLAPFALAATAWWVVRSTRNDRTIAFGFLFFLVNIMFVLQFKGAGKAFMADRFTYIPYFGLFFIVGKYCSDLLTNLKGNGILWVAGALVLLFSGLTVLQNRHWQSSVALWENVTAKFPQDALSWTNKGLAYYDAGNNEKAIQSYDQALKIDASTYDAAHNLGVTYNKLKRYPEAVQAFGKATQIKPASPEAWWGRAQTRVKINDYAAAIADFEKGMELGMKRPRHEMNAALAGAYAGNKQFDRAISLFDAAIQEQPLADYFYQKGNALAAMGNMPGAIAQYDLALQKDPKLTEALNNKGNAFAAMGRFPEAIEAFGKALTVKSDASDIYFNRGMARHASGDNPGACADWQKSLGMGYGQAQAVLQMYCK